MLKTVLLIVPLLLTSCVINNGSKLEDFAPANTDVGLKVELRVRNKPKSAKSYKMEGELLAADNDGIVIFFVKDGLINARVTRIPFELILRATFEGMPQLFIGQSRTLNDSKKEKMRLVSRYPGGVESTGFQTFMERIDQSEIDIVEYKQ